MNKLLIFILLWAEAVGSFSGFAQQKTSSFRFAFITDIHINQANRQNTANLRAAVKDINRQTDIDFVVVAGDIADKGDRLSLLQAKQLLDSLHLPYYAIPGNHDTRYCKTTTSTFDSVFSNHHFSFVHKGYAFVGFNTGQGNGNNRGGVAPQELAWIKKQLDKSKGQPVIAITHFPIVTAQVDDSAKIVATLLKYNVKAILGGHYHRNAAFDYAGVPGILSRTLQLNPAGKAGYSIFAITDNLQVIERDPVTSSTFSWLTLPLKQRKEIPVE